MPTLDMPDRPHLDSFRRQARALQRAVRAGDPDAVARLARHHPGAVPDDTSGVRLSAAQLVLAREYGFASWPRLVRYLETVAEHGWDTGLGAVPAADPAAEFCRLASLTAEDGPASWARARQLLAEHPGLTTANIWAAAAAARPDDVGRLLAERPALATERGGPLRWRPLYYLIYSRFDPAVPAERVLAVGRLLLDAGADPNDAQTLYNRMFAQDDSHLELLFEHGLGTGDGGPWKTRIEDLSTPEQMLRVQLRWAVEHHQPARVRLLVDHGVDFRSPFEGDGPAWSPGDGRTPVELAQLCGDTEIADHLLAKGAVLPGPDPVRELVAAAFRADRSTLDQIRAEHPDAVARARRTRPGLVVWAATQAPVETVTLLAELGFDVNTYGRGDAPVEQAWETALHHAAVDGNVELTRRLLALGADPDLRDQRFDATPLDWARRFHQLSTAALLEPVTTPPASDR